MGHRKDLVKHGRARRGAKTRLYRIWTLMRDRCNNQKSPVYYRYGGRGIVVCEEWSTFIPFESWAMANGYASDLTIDRVDNDGNYEPSNCRWLTRSENIQESWKSRKQQRRGGVRFTIADVSQMKQCLANGESQADVSRKFDIHSSELSQIARSLKWADVPPLLNYKGRPKTKIPDAEVPNVRRRVSAGETMASLAREYGVDPSTISVICSKKSRVTRTLPVFCD